MEQNISLNEEPVLGATAKGLGPDLLENLAWLRENGLSGVELSVASWATKTDGFIHRETDLERLKLALEPFQQVTLHATYHNQSGLSFLNWCEPIRNACFEELKFNVEVARKIGASIVTFHSGAQHDGTPYPEIYCSEDYFKELLSVELRRLDQLVAGSGIMLGLENADYFQPAEYFEFYRSLNLESIKLTLDTNHMSKPYAGYDVHHTDYNAYEKYGSIAGFVKAFNKDIVHVHLNDYDIDNCVGCGHLPVGDGKVNIPEILSELLATGYRNMLSFELGDKAGICRAKKRTEDILLELEKGLVK